MCFVRQPNEDSLEGLVFFAIKRASTRPHPAHPVSVPILDGREM